MRIRTIKPDFWANEKMASLEPFDRLLAIGLLNLADDKGYFRSHPAVVAGHLFPFEKNGRSLVEKGLSNLAKTGFICRLGHEISHVVNFTTHQKINRPSESKLELEASEITTFSEPSLSPHCSLSEPSLPEKEKEREKERYLGKGKVSRKAENADAENVMKYLNILEAWNEQAKVLKLPLAEKLYADRFKKISALVDYLDNGEADILEAIGYIHLNQYWKTSNGKYKPPGFDWLLRNDKEHTVRDLLELGRSKRSNTPLSEPTKLYEVPEYNFKPGTERLLGRGQP